MAKYLFTYRGGSMPEDDAERAAVMAAWGAWFGGIGAGVVDAGNPCGASAGVSTGGAVAEASALVGGYSLIAADDLAAATEVAKGCPILAAGGSVDVHEVVEIM